MWQQQTWGQTWWSQKPWTEQAWGTGERQQSWSGSSWGQQQQTKGKGGKGKGKHPAKNERYGEGGKSYGKGWNRQKPDLRFAAGDRVLCNMGDFWVPGKILDCNVTNPEDPTDKVPYVVKTDITQNAKESRTISVPYDDDKVCRREVCFGQVEWKLSSDASPLRRSQDSKLRFEKGCRVAFRVRDSAQGFDQWQTGVVEATCFQLQDGVSLPYMLRAESGLFFFAHLDDHTLVRLPANVPQKRCKGIAKRLEARTRVDGQQEKFDHVTLRGRIIQEQAEELSD
eukprot:TRINITY_DN24141_c0_g1_i1.p1 TRINITY_DN24141_c0_g1~~TRINITY_DN24141_c0_g1_i1.p1  ORF type:complete len:305 (-),score=42.66 TRINITY_DN24141_c0_g1_i1:233-1081(-)